MLLYPESKKLPSWTVESGTVHVEFFSSLFPFCLFFVLLFWALCSFTFLNIVRIGCLKSVSNNSTTCIIWVLASVDSLFPENRSCFPGLRMLGNLILFPGRGKYSLVETLDLVICLRRVLMLSVLPLTYLVSNYMLFHSCVCDRVWGWLGS